jgi:hypothetical protein
MGGGWVAFRECVRCMQWLCCVFVVGKVWRIVPCVYKIYTLGHFHGLLETFLFAIWGGMYIVKEGCVFR